jgi:ABC-type glycerol-3-phosphate transport system substrate-binding protein
VDVETGTPVFDQAEAVEAVKFLTEQLASNSIPFADMQNSEQFPFVNGKAAMTYINQDTILNIISKNPELANNIGVASNVPGKKAATFSGLRTFAISNTSKNKDEAWEFIKFMMSKERMANRMKQSVPPVRKSLQEEFIKLNPKVNRAIAEAVSIGLGRPSVTWSPLYTKYATQGYEQAIFKNKPVEQALKDAVNDLKKEIKR